MSWWDHGDEYRWSLVSGIAHPTISVIEPAEQAEPRRQKRRVPFGFARALTEADALVWEGED